MSDETDLGHGIFASSDDGQRIRLRTANLSNLTHRTQSVGWDYEITLEPDTVMRLLEYIGQVLHAPHQP